jgi:hypothetical protein
MKQSFLETMYDIAQETKNSPRTALNHINGFMNKYAERTLRPAAFREGHPMNRPSNFNSMIAKFNQEENVLCVTEYDVTGQSITKCSIYDLEAGHSLKLEFLGKGLNVDLQNDVPKTKIKELKDFYLG